MGDVESPPHVGLLPAGLQLSIRVVQPWQGPPTAPRAEQRAATAGVQHGLAHRPQPRHCATVAPPGPSRLSAVMVLIVPGL